jgi:hypothetical protein
MFPEWTWIVGLLIGAAFGSFLNVVIYRMPLGLSLKEPKHSFCPVCKHRLTILDLFPLFSWLFLRGKCRHCKAPIPARYFFVEVITGSLWAVVWYQQLVMTWNVPLALLYFAMISALVAATFIDLRWFIIPDQINALQRLLDRHERAERLDVGNADQYRWSLTRLGNPLGHHFFRSNCVRQRRHGSRRHQTSSGDGGMPHATRTRNGSRHRCDRGIIFWHHPGSSQKVSETS